MSNRRDMFTAYYGADVKMPPPRTPDQQLTSALMNLASAQDEVIREMAAVIETLRDENSDQRARMFPNVLNKKES